jgi:hypothetical protein
VLQTAWTDALKDFKAGIGNKLQTTQSTFGGKDNAKTETKIDKIADDPVLKRLNSVTLFMSEHFKL